MRFNSVLISSFFASAVLAFESQLWNDRAGSLLTLVDDGTIQRVSSTINAPDIIDRELGSSCFAFVGIDGTTTCPVMLHLGVKFIVTTEGPCYSVAYRYGEEFTKIFFNKKHVPIATHDAIKLTVEAPVGRKLGVVKAENLTNNKSHTHEINLPESLCGKTAEWIVEEDEIPSVNLGPITFYNTQVGGDDFGSQMWNVTNIDIDGKLKTAVDVSGDSVTITW